MSRYRRTRLPQGQSSFTIKVGGGGRHAGEYEGASTIRETAQMARSKFVPYVNDYETVKVVHFDRSGERTIVDEVVKG